MIAHVTIGYLKAFGKPQSLALACNNGAGLSKLTLLVGPNNSGKSSLIAAIEGLLTSDSSVFTAAKEHRHGENIPVLTVQCNGETISLSEGAGSKFSIDGSLDKVKNSIKVLPSRRTWTESFGTSMDDSAYQTNWRINRRSNRHYVDSQFGSALMHLSLTKDKKHRFSELLKKVDPSIQDWRAETSGGYDFIEYLGDVGEWHRIGDIGDGVSSIFRICYEVLNLKPGVCLLIDEPELSLHPQVQRNLARILLETSLANQMIVATHSPHFLSWDGLKAGAVACRLNMTESGSILSTLGGLTLKSILSVASNDRKNAMLYDAVAKEVFFSKGTLFVEGVEDANIIRSYVQECGLPELEIFGYGSGGAPNIITWLTMCSELGIRAFGLYDGDPAGDDHYDKACARFAGDPLVRVGRLWTKDIRDKPDERKDGVFDEHWKIKSSHEKGFLELIKNISCHIRNLAE